MKIRQKKSGKHFLDFTYKGQRVRRVIGYSKREAEDALAAIRGDIIRGKYGLPREKTNVMFEEFAEEFLELYSKQNKKSWKTDEIHIARLKLFFKGKSLSNITPDLIEKYKAERSSQVAPGTVNREISCLKTLFTKAVEWEKVEKSPAKKVKRLKENNIKERILVNDEMKRLLEAAWPRIRPVLIIALNTGMRRSEILSLEWKHVNLQKKYIFIEDSKSGRSRKVPMNSLVLDAFRHIKRSHEFVFYNPKTRSNIKDIKTAFRTACKNAGIKNLRLHDLRHTAATRMIEAGIDLVTVSKILGHSSIQMTMRYAHPTPENMQRAVDRLGEIFHVSQEVKINEILLDKRNDMYYIVKEMN